MTIKSTLYKMARKPLRLLGLELVKFGERRSSIERMQLVRDLGFQPRRVVDGGAFHGTWSVEIAGLYPDAQFMLIEPNPYLQETITENVRGLEATVVNVALADSPRTASFNFWNEPTSDASASLLDHVSGPSTSAVEVDVDTLDNICERLSFSPDLIKLDLQGAELAALEGARNVLQGAEFAVIEFGVLEAYVGRTSPRELLDFMYDNDFTLYDIVDCINRPYDNALCAGDFFFVKKSSPLRAYKGYDGAP